MSKKPAAPGMIYLLWAEHTSVFKVGFTRRSVDQRALEIEGMSPVQIRIVAERPGTRADESRLHYELRQFRSHAREWFSLPEPMVWWVLSQFGVKPPEGAVVEIDTRKKGEVPQAAC